MDLTQRELLLVIANFILIVIAVFLFLQLRKTGKKSESKKVEHSDLKGIADLAPEEFKPERFDLKPHDAVPAKTLGLGAVPKIETQDLKFEDDIQEIRSVVPVKKTSRKKNTAKKLPEITAEGVMKEAAPVKKASRKKKAVKVEPEIVAQGVIKELSEIAPEKKTRRKKKTVKTEPSPEEATKELIEAATVKLDAKGTIVPVQGTPAMKIEAKETIAPVQEAPAVKTEPAQGNLIEKKGETSP
ncbi:Uncharacterised protein [uncultured archaeon]|nr:Uncharacterised protein [uncultured archaeon]